MAGKPFSRAKIIERFWDKVNKNGPNGCWLWLGSKATRNYGRVWIHGTTINAHRFAYELLVGPMPDNTEFDHLCRVHECVRPSHLEPVSHKVNILRGDSPSAIHARKTHCPQGHPYNNLNTYRWRNRRRCRICGREGRRRYKQRKRNERKSLF